MCSSASAGPGMIQRHFAKSHAIASRTAQHSRVAPQGPIRTVFSAGPSSVWPRIRFGAHLLCKGWGRGRHEDEAGSRAWSGSESVNTF